MGCLIHKTNCKCGTHLADDERLLESLHFSINIVIFSHTSQIKFILVILTFGIGKIITPCAGKHYLAAFVRIRHTKRLEWPYRVQ